MRLPVGAIRHDTLAHEFRRERERNNRRIEFGDGPEEDFEIGGSQNIRGAWVVEEIDAINVPHVFTHNLRLDFSPAFTQPNVSWGINAIKHSGAGGGILNIDYDLGDPVTANAISLRLRSDGARTVNASNPATVLVFFIPVREW